MKPILILGIMILLWMPAMIAVTMLFRNKNALDQKSDRKKSADAAFKLVTSSFIGIYFILISL